MSEKQLIHEGRYRIVGIERYGSKLGKPIEQGEPIGLLIEKVETHDPSADH